MAVASCCKVVSNLTEDEEPPGRAALAMEGAPGPLTNSRRRGGFPLRAYQPPFGSGRITAFREAFYPNVRDASWNDWHWQIRSRIRTLAELEKMLFLSDEERDVLSGGGGMLPFGITPHYAGLVYGTEPGHPLRRAVIPTVHEWAHCEGEADDPLGEDDDTPVPGIVHRYPDRVLLLATGFCSTYCRYCTRSRVVGHGSLVPCKSELQVALDYIRRSPEVRDVLISGGDPLTLSDTRLEWLLGELRSIPHVEIIRIGTKVPTVLPQRVTPGLCRVLKRYHPLFISIHFTHPEECTAETAKACERLANAGIPLGSQTVLLKGVNDSVPVMKELMHRLLQMRVRPYYLYQCDPITGSSHFRTPVSKGLEIIQGLRGHTSGYAIPTFVIDAPGGGGKIPLQPDYVVGRDGDDLLLRNYEGEVFRYPDALTAGEPTDGAPVRFSVVPA